MQPASPPTSELTESAWQRILARAPDACATAPLYAGLVAPPEAADGLYVIGRIAQTLDGRIATLSGRSFWISGDADILHTHRLRALSDAIVVGAGTIRADDPQLTTRRCTGHSPTRVVIDTDRRLSADYRVFRDDPTTVVIAADDVPGTDQLGRAEVIRIPRAPTGGLDCAALLRALAARGLHRVFVEGGGMTVSRFIAQNCLDRLHVTIAPMLLGAGIPAFTLPGVDTPQQGRRLEWTVHQLGPDLLLDMPMTRAIPT
jgi:diaminohydroxyphosphoribosylaminopyrimidine deaminase/5-amino-6-(5-phosphoribosylamino)uracil reductase